MRAGASSLTMKRKRAVMKPIRMIPKIYFNTVRIRQAGMQAEFKFRYMHTKLTADGQITQLSFRIPPMGSLLT